MEKLSLRSKTLNQVNNFFDDLFGVNIVFACSCGVGAVYTKDLAAFIGSDYYCQREAYGRMYDSDMVGVQGALFMSDSIDLVPSRLILSSRDVGKEEIESYHRYLNALKEIMNEPVKVSFRDPSLFFNN